MLCSATLAMNTARPAKDAYRRQLSSSSSLLSASKSFFNLGRSDHHFGMVFIGGKPHGVLPRAHAVKSRESRRFCDDRS
jgi:hypothetical protein